MYIIRDALSPAINLHKDAVAFKNTILKYWPRNGLNFGNLITQTPAGVEKDNAHRRIYHVLGMRIKDMEAHPLNPDEIDFTYIHLNAYSAPNGVVADTDVRAYINSYSPLIYPLNKDKFNPDPIQTVITDMNPDPNKGTQDAYWDAQGWITSMLVYQPTTLSLVDNGITDAQIIQKIIDVSYTDIFYDPMKSSRLTAVAMIDMHTNSVFETSARIVSRSYTIKDSVLSANNIGQSTGIVSQQVRYVATATIEFRFRRITDVSVGLILSANANTFISAVVTRCNALAPVDIIKNNFGLRSAASISLYTGISAAKAFARSISGSVSQQLVLLANWIYPHVDTLMFTVNPAYVNSYYPSTLETEVKIDGLINLPPKQFKKTFLSLMKFDYHRHEKKGHWYDKVVAVVIIIVAIAVAVFSGGSLTWVSAAMILSVTALALTVWSMYLVKNGGGNGAISLTMNMANIIGIAAMVAGIAAIYQAWANQAAREAAKAAAKESLDSAIKAGASDQVISAAADAYVNAFIDAASGSMTTIIGEGISAAANAASKIGLIDDKVAGIAGMIGGSYDSIASIGTTSATSITLDSIVNNIEEGIKKFITKPLSEILNMTMNWLSTGFHAYMSYVDKGNEGLADKKAQLDAISKEVEDTNPEHIENIWKTYEDPYGSCFETPDTATTVIMMTTGKLRSSMNKCYDSGFRI